MFLFRENGTLRNIGWHDSEICGRPNSQNFQILDALPTLKIDFSLIFPFSWPSRFYAHFFKSEGQPPPKTSLLQKLKSEKNLNGLAISALPARLVKVAEP